ncbi:MAG TPA: hypothetical protein DD621_00455 [Clostridiales bacterium]|nr:hypothetical protein [Clostridiales bacterium]
MDLKAIFKNKFVIIGLALTVLIVISGLLSTVNLVFYRITCILCALLCIDIGIGVIFRIKKIKSDDQSQLLPLTEQDKEYVSRKRKSEIFNNVLIIIMFFCASIVFITFAFK